MQQLPATAKTMMEFATGTYEKFAAVQADLDDMAELEKELPLIKDRKKP